MGSISFLSTQDVLLLHRLSVRRYGGSEALLDPGRLDGALAMPRQQALGQYLHESIEHMAAAYLFHICQNHPFEDGNKRTAFAAAATFLMANGMRLIATEDDAAETTLAVARGEMGKPALAVWIGQHVAPRSPDGQALAGVRDGATA